MRWGRSVRWMHALLSGTALLGGCRGADQLHYFGDADLQYYRNTTMQVEYAAVDDPTPQEVIYSQRPRTVKERAEDEIWDMPLMEAMHLALANNKMIRTRASQPQLLLNPAQSPSIYDPALRASGFLFGNRGVEAALADFDAQFSTSMVWGRNEDAANLASAPDFIATDETGMFTSQLFKTLATGGNIAINHNWNYRGTNLPDRQFPSDYRGVLQAVFNQPLLAGAGVEYTRIAAPARAGLGAVTGVSQGVVIARINEDISVADFETAVINMVKDVEDLYWDLYLAYRQFDAESKNRDSAYETWKRVRAFMKAQVRGGEAGAEAQARENYFEVRSRVETALSNIYSVENQLRRQLGLPVNDGRVIRPSDDPLRAEYVVNWETSLAEALNRRVELRRQKWQIKSLELQVTAAENVARPSLNLVSSYTVNGYGDQLLSQQTENFNSAIGTMANGNLTGWTAGLQFQMPIGLRAAHAQLRNLELQLTKARAGLAAQELDISHDLADAMQRVDLAYTTAQSNFDRRVASELRVWTEEKKLEVSVEDASVDLVLRAQASRAAAEIAFFTSLIDYNKAIVDLNLRRGTLLEINNIELSEQAWVAEAQDEALRRAWARSFAKPNDKLDTRPAEFSSPVPYLKNDLFPGTPMEQNGPASDGTIKAEPLPPPAVPYESPPKPVFQPQSPQGGL